MNPSQIQETTCNHNIESLHTLIKILKMKNCEHPAYNILEVAFLKKFPASEMTHPVEGFSPRQIIEDMMEKHKRTQDNISENFDMLKTFTCTCKIDEKEHKFTFSNNMEFYADIQTICYLYHKILRYDIQRRATQEVMTLMVNKYQINTEIGIDLDPKMITFSRIANSYPSVTLSMFNRDFGCYSIFLSYKFPKFKHIPRMMFSPVVPSILPNLKNPPIAVLTAIFLKLDDMSKRDDVEKISLRTIYNRVITPYIHTIFPERLKLMLCTRWKIVVIEEHEHIFSPRLTECRQKAKNLISKLRPKDPDLEKILSEM